MVIALSDGDSVDLSKEKKKKKVLNAIFNFGRPVFDDFISRTGLCLGFFFFFFKVI